MQIYLVFTQSILNKYTSPKLRKGTEVLPMRTPSLSQRKEKYKLRNNLKMFSSIKILHGYVKAKVLEFHVEHIREKCL